MPWSTPTLKATRRLTRDYVLSQLGAKAMIPNSALRIMSDAKAGLAHLAFLYLDWLAKQLLPDTAEQEWLDRHGIIWLVNSDGSKGRKAATYANGTIEYEGNNRTVIPVGTLIKGASGIQYQSTSTAEIGDALIATADVAALTAGIAGNLPQGEEMSCDFPGVTGVTTYTDLVGGSDGEKDEQLRERILKRIQNPPMGGALHDYEQWALAVPGVTRAWASVEMGPGTITVRFLMDDAYPNNYGLPTAADVALVESYINQMRPVAVKDCFVFAPILQFYNVSIINLIPDTSTVRGAIEASIKDMEFKKAVPGGAMYRSWVDEAVSQAVGEQSHELQFDTVYVPAPGYMPTLGTIYFHA